MCIELVKAVQDLSGGVESVELVVEFFDVHKFPRKLGATTRTICDNKITFLTPGSQLNWF